MEAHVGTGRPPFAVWRAEIEKSSDAESLLGAVREYLGQWSPEALAQLPADLAAPTLPACDVIHTRAFTASQAELAMRTDDPRHAALREMALVLTAAAGRLQVLHSYAAVSRLKAASRALPRGALEAEVRMKRETR